MAAGSFREVGEGEVGCVASASGTTGPLGDGAERRGVQVGPLSDLGPGAGTRLASDSSDGFTLGSMAISGRVGQGVSSRWENTEPEALVPPSWRLF